MTATFASGKVLTNTYDAIGRVTQRRLGLASNYDMVLTYKPGANSSQTALLATYKNGSDTAYAYEYDANGNITSITQGTVSVTYTYNDANELIRENNGFTNQTVTYTYDDWGNITEKKVYAYTTAADPGTPTQTIPYVYGNSAWGDQLTSYNNQSISYDAMGNPTSYLGSTLTWEGKQLTGVGTTTYAYDENGLRTQKTVSGTTTNYYYNGSVLMSLVQGGNTLLFSYDAQGRAAAVSFNGTYYYYIRNGQGDVIKLIDNSKNTVVEYTYDTWGKQISCTGSLASTLGVLNPFRYRGYVYDEETNFYYLQSRYYDPTVGRFISADILLSTGQGVIGHNTYAYCLNNPGTFLDGDGTMPWSWLLYWGEVHQYVQEEICRIYGYVMEESFDNNKIRVDILSEFAIWEVKSAGPASLLGGTQLLYYLSKLGDDYEVGSGIALHEFTRISKSGHLLYICYWEDPDQPGLIKYVFSSSEDGLKKEKEKYQTPSMVPSTDPSPKTMLEPSVIMIAMILLAAGVAFA